MLASRTRRVDIPRFEVSPGQTIALRAGSPVHEPARRATELVSVVPPWLGADHEQLSGRVLRAPEPSEIQAPVDTADGRAVLALTRGV